jgi:hypothetical protein
MGEELLGSTPVTVLEQNPAVVHTALRESHPWAAAVLPRYALL